MDNNNINNSNYGNGNNSMNDPYGNMNNSMNDPYGNMNNSMNNPYGNMNNSTNDPYGNMNNSTNDPYGNMNNSMNAPFDNVNSSVNLNKDQANTNNYQNSYDNNGVENYTYAQGFDEVSQGRPAKDKNGTISLVIGIVMNVINLSMLCCALFGGSFFFGGFFIIVPIYGLISGINAKKNGNNGLGITGIILNIAAIVGSAFFIIIGIISKIGAILG